MSKPIVGVIADDFTGATDIGGLLARTRAGVALHTGLPEPEALRAASVHVIALKIRTIPVPEACAQALEALRLLKEAGASQIYWKYCSTFDSTDRGNIGPVAEALMGQMGAAFTIYCPAFPENGRVVKGGSLYVNGVPLSQSPMKDHPLTPMRESDLVKVLTPQVTYAVARLPESRTDVEKMARDGIAHFIADAADQKDLIRLGKDYGDLPLLTGGSAFAAAAYGARDGKPARRAPVPEAAQNGTALIISGSCSKATRQQVAQFAESGGQVVTLDPLTLTPDTEAALTDCVTSLLGDAPILLTSTSEPDALRRIQAQLGSETASARIEGAMARIAMAARAHGATRFVVAGGETSGAVTAGLGAVRLDLRNEIAPGVPWCLARDSTGPFALALKSGNFGGPNFFRDALSAL